jgi:hypothetical protein
MTAYLGVGDTIIFRAQGLKEINVVTIEHGDHPNLLRITTRTKDGQEIDHATVELESLDD